MNMSFYVTTSVPKYKTLLEHNTEIKKVGCSIKFVDSWYYFYNFIFQEIINEGYIGKDAL
jgi:hypothetical protein